MPKYDPGMMSQESQNNGDPFVKRNKSKKVVGIGSLIAVLAIGGVVAMLFFLFYPEYQNSQIIKNGVETTGIIRSVNETGSTYNDQPQMKIVLDVEGPNGTYEAVTRMIVSFSNLPRLQPGVRAKVFYDPEDLSKVAIESVEWGSAGGVVELSEEDWQEFQEFQKWKEMQQE